MMYFFLERNSISKRYYAGKFDVSCNMSSNVIHLILRDSDTDSENLNLIGVSVSDGQKTCS